LLRFAILAGRPESPDQHPLFGGPERDRNHGECLPTRTSDQTLYVQFSNSTNPPDFWDPVATRLSAERHLTLSENAHLLALLNIALADAVVGCWDAKYTYDSWRPITAI